jgi:hypothetical protein
MASGGIAASHSLKLTWALHHEQTVVIVGPRKGAGKEEPRYGSEGRAT